MVVTCCQHVVSIAVVCLCIALVESSWAIYCTCHQFEGLASLWRPMPWRQRLKLPRARCGGCPAWRVALKRICGPFIVIILAILSQGEATCGLISNRNRLLLDLVTAVHGQAVVMFKCTRLQSKWMQMKVWRHFNALPQCNARNRFPTGKVRGRCGNQVKISHPLRSKNKLKLRPKPKRRKRLGNVDRDGIGWNGLVLFGTVCQFKCLKVSWVYIFRESTDKSEPMLQHARN